MLSFIIVVWLLYRLLRPRWFGWRRFGAPWFFRPYGPRFHDPFRGWGGPGPHDFHGPNGWGGPHGFGGPGGWF